jgi:hypothetical protein
MPADVNERRFPSAEDEARFWALAGAAWAQCSAGANRVRRALAARAPARMQAFLPLTVLSPEFLGTLADQCRELPGGELTSLDRVLERKLYDIGRSDIQAVTGGPDDGFLYARGFIVAMGRDSCHAVAGDRRWPCRTPSAWRCAISSRTCIASVPGISRRRARGFPANHVPTRPAGPADPAPDRAVQNPCCRRPAPRDKASGTDPQAAGSALSSLRFYRRWQLEAAAAGPG